MQHATQCLSVVNNVLNLHNLFHNIMVYVLHAVFVLEYTGQGVVHPVEICILVNLVITSGAELLH